MSVALDALLAEIGACRRCADRFPHEPRPVLRVSETARILIVGQAPGTKVHKTGLPFDDPSGDRLRDWMGIDRATFYDRDRIAIMPAGLCYPGHGTSGDLPPVALCAPLWHPRVRAHMPAVALVLLAGRYALDYYLRPNAALSVAELVEANRDPLYFAAPHPSPRNRRWLRLHPWFETERVPILRSRVASLL